MELRAQYNTERHMLRAIFNDNNNYYSQKSWDRYILCNRKYLTDSFSQILNNPDAYLGKNILKQDATATVSVTVSDNIEMVIKRYNIKGLKHAIKRALQPSRAFHNWKCAHQLIWHGIATPQPIAVIERRIGPFRRQAYYIYEYISGPEGFEVFRDNPAPAAITQIRAEKTVNLINQLLNKGFSHGDLKASNFIYQNNDPYFIDLDAMCKHRFRYTFKRRKKKEIKRFLRNWIDVKTYLLFAGLLKN